jgi:type VI secretion system secreted protein VgrG
MSMRGDAAAGQTQAGRLLAIETALGRDKLLLIGLEGEEQISRPFSYMATMLSADLDIRPDKLIGSNATAWVMRGDGERAPMNGFVRRFIAGPVGAHGLREYRAELVPWLWFLTCTSDCRIFQNITVPELLKQVFEDFGLVDYSAKGLTGTYPKLEYCVQYRESAFSFVSRWMEEAGLFYFFTHEAGKHTLVLADRNFQFQPAAEGEAIYAGKDDAETSAHVTRWHHAYEFRPGRYAQKDFNFETPSAALLTQEASVLGIPHADGFELYDYPGRYSKMDYGQSLTRARIEEEEAQYHTVEGDSGYASFRAGHRFTLARHDIASEESKAYVLFRVTHKARDTSHLAADAEASSYQNSFVAMPADVRFRAARQTRCPVMQGPQTAMVVGPPGETIHTDKHGRVKLQFHWDREGKRDDRSSCWVRVSQAWAGAGWGGVNIPHVGHEVVVSFLEGDPDRPLVTGRVYNGENAKAVGLPANKTQSAMRDHSGNEIVMEGKGGSQDVRIVAVKDQNITVAHDYNETVKSGNRKIDVLAGTHTETIKGDTSVTVVTGAYAHTVAANKADRVSKGPSTLASTTANIYVDAATNIQLYVGASMLWMDSGGHIHLKATKITLEGSGEIEVMAPKVSVNGSTSVEVTGATVTAQASGTHNIKGALVKIN